MPLTTGQRQVSLLASIFLMSLKNLFTAHGTRIDCHMRSMAAAGLRRASDRSRAAAGGAGFHSSLNRGRSLNGRYCLYFLSPNPCLPSPAFSPR
jgi:hypothetical protein